MTFERPQEIVIQLAGDPEAKTVMDALDSAAQSLHRQLSVLGAA